MRLSTIIIATYATLDDARRARVELSNVYDNLVIKSEFDTYKLIRYEVNSPYYALDSSVADTPGSPRNSAKSRKRQRSQSVDVQLYFEQE